MESRHFTCFGKIGEIISMVPKEQGAELAYALVLYGTLGQEATFDDPMTSALYESLKDDVDQSLLKIEQGKRGGRPPKDGDKKANEKPWFSETETMVSENENHGFQKTAKTKNPRQDKTRHIDVSKETSDIKSAEPDPIPYSEIVGALNAKAGTGYRSDGRKTRSLIAARWREGFRLADFVAVIDAKCAEWRGDPSMSRYLRPETLFGTKFEGYLQTAPIAAEAKAGSSLPASHRPDYGKEGW